MIRSAGRDRHCYLTATRHGGRAPRSRSLAEVKKRVPSPSLHAKLYRDRARRSRRKDVVPHSGRRPDGCGCPRRSFRMVRCVSLENKDFTQLNSARGPMPRRGSGAPYRDPALRELIATDLLFARASDETRFKPVRLFVAIWGDPCPMLRMYRDRRHRLALVIGIQSISRPRIERGVLMSVGRGPRRGPEAGSDGH
jgi:hypothetical protein